MTEIGDITLLIIEDEVAPKLGYTGREFFLQDTLKPLATMNNPAFIPKGLFVWSLRGCT